MKLSFIWIAKFRNFENTGINFSSSEKFSYDDVTGKISIKKINELPLNFFGERITEITGLIGKNGSGKSNALDLVCKLVKGGRTSIKEPFFLIFQDENEFICYHNFDEESKLKSDFQIKFTQYEKNIDPLKVVFFSNVFDERLNKFDREVTDISYNRRYLKQRAPFSSIRKDTTDFYKQIKFIESDLFQKLRIESPEEIIITSKLETNTSYNYNMKYFNYDFDESNSFRKIFFNRLREIRPHKKLYYLLIYSYFLETTNLVSRNYRKISDDSSINDLNRINQESKYYKTEDYAEIMLNLCITTLYSFQLKYELKRHEKIKFNNLLQKIESIKILKDDIINLDVREYSEGSNNRRLDYYTLRFNKLNRKALSKIIPLFETNSFKINWVGISSGHKAYLDIFSQLFHELKQTKKENLLLCIDEGDLYLHPQWQIEFFSKLIDIIPNIFGGRIQLILTSHSPFLLSDLPKQNVTIISPNESQNVIDGIELKTETFAGNIYTLYSEPFFLGNKRMSVFAENKIQEILDEIENLKDDIDRVGLEKKVSLIGDEVIKYYLMKKLKND